MKEVGQCILLLALEVKHYWMSARMDSREQDTSSNDSADNGCAPKRKRSATQRSCLEACFTKLQDSVPDQYKCDFCKKVYIFKATSIPNATKHIKVSS